VTKPLSEADAKLIGNTAIISRDRAIRNGEAWNLPGWTGLPRRRSLLRWKAERAKPR
jgi:hypothetical protein